MSIPFSCPVKITGITVIGGDRGKSPNKVNLFANMTDPAMAEEIEPSQTIEPLVEDFCGILQYPLRVVKFGNINTLTLQFPSDQSFDITWIGLRGIASGDKRKAVVTVYESRPLIADHQVKDQYSLARQIQ